MQKQASPRVWIDKVQLYAPAQHRGRSCREFRAIFDGLGNHIVNTLPWKSASPHRSTLPLGLATKHHRMGEPGTRVAAWAALHLTAAERTNCEVLLRHARKAAVAPPSRGLGEELLEPEQRW